MAVKMTRQERLESDRLIEAFSGRPRVMFLEFNGKRTRLDPMPGFAIPYDLDDLFPAGNYGDLFFAGLCPRRRFLTWARRAGVIPAAARGKETGFGQHQWRELLYDKAKIYPDGVPATIAVMRRPRGDAYVFGVRPESRLSATREESLDSWDEG